MVDGNMVDYIFENLPVPVKHLCDPDTAKEFK